VAQLTEHRDKLDAIVIELLANETLDEDAVYAAAGIERPHDDREMVKTNTKTSLDSPRAVPDAPWEPPSATEKIDG
jgi:cell division protease FtsH